MMIQRSCTSAEALTPKSPDYSSPTWSNPRNSTNSLCFARSWITTSKRSNEIRKEKPLLRGNLTEMLINPVMQQTSPISTTMPNIVPPLPAMVHITALDPWSWMPMEYESSPHRKRSDGGRKDFVCDVGKRDTSPADATLAKETIRATTLTIGTALLISHGKRKRTTGNPSRMLLRIKLNLFRLTPMKIILQLDGARTSLLTSPLTSLLIWKLTPWR